VVGIEARGFIFGAALAYRLGAGLVPVRKAGKLPHRTKKVSFQLEYGSATVEIHEDAIHRGSRVLIVDDLLATGGTLAAAVELVEHYGGEIIGISVLIELDFLQGRQKLGDHPFYPLIHF
jgi:adenine phosphoribosyltransferase